MQERHGSSWTKKEDKKLIKLFNESKSFIQMAHELKRTWFACKCRLIRLGVIEGSLKNPHLGETMVEPFRVPNPHSQRDFELIIDTESIGEEDTSKTFSDAELNIVMDYLKTRLARLAVQKVDSDIFVHTLQISQVEQTLTDELNKVKNIRKLSIKERERVLTRFA